MLADSHYQELSQGSLISDDVIRARGYDTIEDGAALEAVGIPRWAWRGDDALPGLLVPMHTVNGEQNLYQFKPRVPQLGPDRDKPVKYISSGGKGVQLDVPPSVLDLVRDPEHGLWITEGPKKADCLASKQKAVVTLTGVWNWRNKAGTLGEWEDIPLRGRSVVICFDSDTNTNDQVRSAMRRLGAWLTSRGADVRYLIVPSEVNGKAVKGVDDYFAAGGTMAGLAAAAMVSLPAENTKDADDIRFTESRVAELAVDEALSGRYVYTKELGWLKYDGVRWADSSEVSVIEEVRVWVQEKWGEVSEEYKKDQSRDVKARLAGWHGYLSRGKVVSIAQFTKGLLERSALDFDRDPWLLNCPNGVVDLRTGELRASSPDDMMRKVAGAAYVAGARDDAFEKALTCLPEEYVDWYQMRIGQSFTGFMPPDDTMVVQKGGGENGKTTLAEAFSGAAGGYYVKVSDRVLIGSSDQHPTEFMDFMGARYAVIEETPEGRTLNVTAMKKIVGTPEITARRIRQDSVTFPVTHSLWLNTNYTPDVPDAAHSTWRRLKLVVFPYRYVKHADQIRTANDRLGDKLLRLRVKSKPALEAALAWAVAGAGCWYRDQLQTGGEGYTQTPEGIEAATYDWSQEGDTLVQWARENIVFDLEAKVPQADVYQNFSLWLSTTGQMGWSAKTFVKRLREHDLAIKHQLETKTARLNGKPTKVWAGMKFGKLDTIEEDDFSNPFGMS